MSKQLSIIQAAIIQGAGLTGMAFALIAQPAFANVAVITEVQLNATDQGIEVFLESSDNQPLRTFSASYGNTLVIDIVNARLDLADGTDFRQTNPAEGIASVTVEALDTNSVRVTVLGESDVPQVQVAQSAPNLVLSVSAPSEVIAEQPEPASEPSPPSTPDPTPPPLEEESPEIPDSEEPDIDAEGEDDGTLRITVTGEQVEAEEAYRVPNATTGTRTDTPILEVPQAVQVVPQEVLEDQAATDLQEALRNVSGISQGNTTGNTEDVFTIRGFSGVTVLQDGFRTIEGNSRETANLERIEVLQGPASVLFGSGEPGGVINLVTERPLPDPFYEILLRAGNESLFRSELDLSGPVSSDREVLYRLNAVYEGAEGFREFDQDIERVFVGPILSLAINDRTDLILEFDYLYDERPFDRGLIAFGDEVADIPLDRILGEPDDFFENQEYRVRYRLEHELNDNWTLRNAAQYTSSDSLNFRTEPDELDESTGILSRNSVSNDVFNETYEVQFEIEGNFNTGSVGHTLLLGADFSDESGETSTSIGPAAPLDIFDPEYEVFPSPEISELFTALNLESERVRLGFFLQDQIDITDDLILLLGGRVDILDQSLDQTSLLFGDANPSGQETVFNPRVGVVYQPTETVSLYASYSRSFQPNSVFSVTADGEFVEPERGTQYEVGVKADWLDGRLSSTLAFYNITRTNIAVADPDAPPGSGFVLPIGEQRSRGIGLDIVGEILPGWNVIASYALIDAEITESNDLGTPEGNRVNNVPRNSASLWTAYEISTGALEGLGFGLGFFFEGDREGDPANSFELPSYFRTDAAVSYRRDNWRAALNLRNLFDVDIFESSGNTRERVTPGEPFTILGTVSFEF